MKYAYIYYRIDPVQEATAADRIDALLGLMARHCARPPRRLRRCDDPAVWMEVYEEIADHAAFTAALNAAIRSLGCTAFTLGERHLECFSLSNIWSP
ncbi:MAG: DUF4936 family protein [Hydrogenophilales bacterium]|nr:DUF4936 family protein [Hydrogenophilales bacterium]